MDQPFKVNLLSSRDKLEKCQSQAQQQLLLLKNQVVSPFFYNEKRVHNRSNSQIIDKLLSKKFKQHSTYNNQQNDPIFFSETPSPKKHSQNLLNGELLSQKKLLSGREQLSPTLQKSPETHRSFKDHQIEILVTIQQIKKQWKQGSSQTKLIAQNLDKLLHLLLLINNNIDASDIKFCLRVIQKYLFCSEEEILELMKQTFQDDINQVYTYEDCLQVCKQKMKDQSIEIYNLQENLKTTQENFQKYKTETTLQLEQMKTSYELKIKEQDEHFKLKMEQIDTEKFYEQKKFDKQEKYVQNLQKENLILLEKIKKKKTKMHNLKEQFIQIQLQKKSSDNQIIEKSTESQNQKKNINSLQQNIQNLNQELVQLKAQVQAYENSQLSNSQTDLQAQQFGSGSQLQGKSELRTNKKKKTIRTVRASLALALLKPQKKESGESNKKSTFQDIGQEASNQNQSLKPIIELPK